MIISEEQVRIMLVGNVEFRDWVNPLNEILPEYQIDAVRRVAGFMSQTCHESLNFKVLTENLNYSWEGLRRTFPRHFPTDAIAKQYHRQPERIANRAYANRMGNGPEESGDGWKFRGRGLIQLTGKNNYTAFAKSIGYSLNDAVNYLTTKSGALESACWYWYENNLNRFCDSENIEGLTRAINGGINGLQDRITKYQKFNAILSFSNERIMDY